MSKAKKKSAPNGRGGAGRGQGRKRMLKSPIRTSITVSLTDEEKEDLDARAEADGLSRSSYIRRALGYPPVE